MRGLSFRTLTVSISPFNVVDGGYPHFQKQAIGPTILPAIFGDDSCYPFPLNERKPSVTLDSGKSKNNMSTPGHNTLNIAHTSIYKPLHLMCLAKILCTGILSLAIKWYKIWISMALHKQIIDIFLFSAK